MSEAEQENIGQVPQSPIQIHHQYLKDLSFESPNSPDILLRADTPPEVDIDIAVDTRKLSETQPEYEVVLSVTAKAQRNDKTLFIAEIHYGARVSIHGLEEKQHHPALFIEIPRVLFPFVRMILANMTQTGGFMPLQLAMVDFRAMYLARFAAKNKTEPKEHGEKIAG